MIQTRQDLGLALAALTSAVNALIAAQPAGQDFTPEVQQVKTALTGVTAATSAAQAALNPPPPPPPQTSATDAQIPPAPMTTVAAQPADNAAHQPGTI